MPKIINSGPPLDRLVANRITPNEWFFRRNHAVIPDIDPDGFRLTVDGDVSRAREWTLKELEAEFQVVEVPATLVCAGNRRSEISAIAPIDDQLNWGAEAIGTAKWAGFRLAEVIGASGRTARSGHAAFLALDQVAQPGYDGGRPFPYGSSIPLEKAMHPQTILATMMNGSPLPARHGFPLRVVVPGYIGARSVKWVTRITIQDRPSDNYFQQVAYRLYPSYISQNNGDKSSGLMLAEFAVNSVIAEPAPHGELKEGVVSIRGYAIAGGERTVVRVDVSTDGGRSWCGARLLNDAEPYVWRLWQVEAELLAGDHTLVVRATDSAANSQPERVESVWNYKGYANNAWHRVPVRVRR